ncbi:hypothetical protein GCM10009557_04660 [Virgisporangium ochraceum]|uniref:Secreted protein n=2 Tax=Virgisporangium ochraceum TaxID=65505 RepID=A0A8J3ZKI1_9ACTN|nr:hypothetical protein Voc01_003480 [Virgisporangium ochraceum]
MDPVARRGAVFMVGVLLALFCGYFVGKGSVPRPAPAPADHAHAGPEYSLALEASDFPLGSARDLRFRVVGAAGETVTDFAVRHDERMHVVVVRSDLTGYQHLHPSMGPDGTWSVPLTLGAPGTWRVFADFAAGGVDAVAGSFVSVAGAFSPVPLGPAILGISGVSVTVEGGLRAGGTEPLTLRVSTGPLARYLGAYGHLVLVRTGDLAFVHVHPEDAARADGREVRFWVTPPGPGTYRAFFDFSIGGVLRTAEFTLNCTL